LEEFEEVWAEGESPSLGDSMHVERFRTMQWRHYSFPMENNQAIYSNPWASFRPASVEEGERIGVNFHFEAINVSM